MATKNICTVTTLSELAANDNVLVDHGGLLRKINLKNELDGVSAGLQVESVISDDGTVAAWKYPDGRLTVFGRAVTYNANGYVATKTVSIPVPALSTKPYAATISRTTCGNAAAFLGVIASASYIITNGKVTAVSCALQNGSEVFATANDTERTVYFTFNGYWK